MVLVLGDFAISGGGGEIDRANRGKLAKNGCIKL